MKNSVFTNCDLQGAKFENSELINVDFTSSYNYSINPEVNKVTNAKFSLDGLPGLLDNYNIIIE